MMTVFNCHLQNLHFSVEYSATKILIIIYLVRLGFVYLGYNLETRKLLILHSQPLIFNNAPKFRTNWS